MNRTPPARAAVSARQWELAHGTVAVDWMHSSGPALQMLADICDAAETTVDWLIGNDPRRAQWVIRQYPRVLKCCDKLQFSDPAQALAYLILHLPDRYSRMFQVLERLLASARLPLGRSPSFAAIDIGAGPGPGILAIRGFYAALARYGSMGDPPLPIVPLGLADVVERSRAMPYVMNHFAMALGAVERGYDVPGRPAGRVIAPSPCVAELNRSAMPDYTYHNDFTTLDIREEHNRARHALAAELEREEDVTPSEAHWYAFSDPIRTPSSYALAVMMNFLTTTSAIPAFAKAIERLMRRSLVPGGTVLVVGGIGRKYRDIYPELDQCARSAHLQVSNGFDSPPPAGHRADELTLLRELTH